MAGYNPAYDDRFQREAQRKAAAERAYSKVFGPDRSQAPNAAPYSPAVSLATPAAAIPNTPAPQQNRAPFQFNTPEPAFRMQRPDTQTDALRRVTSATVADPSNPGVPMFTNASMARAGYNRPDIKNLNVVPKETFGGVLGAMMNPGSDARTSAALRAAADRGDWNAIGRYYASQGQPFAGRMYDTGRGAIDQAALYDRAFGSGIKSKAGRDRAAKMLGDIMGNQMQMDVQSLRNQGYLSAQNAQDAAALERMRMQQSGETARNQANISAMAPGREAETRLRRMQADAAKQTIASSPYLNMANSARAIIDSAQFATLPKDAQEYYTKMYQAAMKDYTDSLKKLGIPTQQSMMLDEQKFAQGGQVQPVLNPMGNMGMPSSMASLDPVIRQYGQYVSTATQYGLNPLPLTKFIDLMASARQQLQQLPTQAGMQMMADGGLVDDENLPWWKRMLGMGGNSEQDQLVQEYEARKQQTNMNAIPADSGRVGLTSLPQAMKNRQDRLDEIMQEIRGYATGGAIPVAGKKVIGPGTGTSDSIPAVVDGSRPAALSSGEFVFPKQAVQYFGTDKLNKMIEKARGTK